MHTTINNLRIAYTDEGSGPAVVLIHGFPLSRAMWQPQVAALSAAGFRVVAPDLRGFGDSEAPREGYSMDQFADDIVALMNHLGIGRAVVGGMSMGGYILLNLLKRHPRKVAGAAFLLTRCNADDAAGKTRRAELAAKVRAGERALVEKAFADILFAPRTLKEQPQIVDTVRSWIQKTSIAGLAGSLEAMAQRPDYCARLGEFDHPALVMGADDDQIVPPETIGPFATALPNSTSCVIPGAGHMANLEQPQSVNACLLKFVRLCSQRFDLRDNNGRDV
ncbi:Pimeloyl-ACP methyl ester carboxylesterase [Geoalkalibacter ferrihydriticus]|uniref:Alpha/beta hydrolase n=2 Tax=Geoalkalibacter ferrihydriticus TaxID=392333 RepID=A0A0C2DRU4_9BACT|nr:alpha/beta fold hydrolase [Geoalkalibacter ferrihydriticus]KIH76164.1 alpha/beta hydrolase [Geoalkalibacter ferrihydriticus DSM 17813]SDM41691.1 Pimeloyl-ACP methyl ester carboxylesterase [Geoalkalibacter ferrihydriticus]